MYDCIYVYMRVYMCMYVTAVAEIYVRKRFNIVYMQVCLCMYVCMYIHTIYGIMTVCAY